jgi:hypothetical protein
MSGSANKAMNRLATMPDGEIQEEAAALCERIVRQQGHLSRSLRIRTRRLLAEARGRELPISLMQQPERQEIQHALNERKNYEARHQEELKRRANEEQIQWQKDMMQRYSFLRAY